MELKMKTVIYCWLWLALLSTTVTSVQKAKERKVFMSSEGTVVREETTTPDTECYLYTWFGRVTEKINTTSSCLDLIIDDEEERPCFPPLVWTIIDGNEDNSPDPEDIIAACNQQNPPCRPVCTRGPGETCIKYTQMSDSDDTVVRESHFCGRLVMDNHDAEDFESCRTQYGVDGYNIEICACSSKNRCNGAGSTPVAVSLLAAVAVFSIVRHFSS